MNIPQMFTRTSFCERCAYNRLPYQSSEDVHRHKLRFFVKKNSQPGPFAFDLRKQSKPGKLGYTPHLFVIEKQENGLIHGFKVCCIENCGIIVTDEKFGQVTFSLEQPKKCIWTNEEIIQLYNFHDETFMLDTKEKQIYIEPGIEIDTDPN